MTNNPTIDGVSRELLEQSEAAFKSLIKQITEEDEDGDYWRIRFESRRDQLRALLDAPAVERQSAKCGQCGSTSAEICNQNGCGFLESGNGEPESATLQSTIAQLQARIAELESGRGEPVAAQVRLRPARKDMISYKPGVQFGPWQYTELARVDMKNLCYIDSVGYEIEKRVLYTAPPAPVAVELLRKARGSVSYLSLRGDDIGDENHALLQDIDACLDAAAALNKLP